MVSTAAHERTGPAGRTWRGWCGTTRGAACRGSSTGSPGWSWCGKEVSQESREAIARQTHCAQSQIGSTNMTTSASNSRSLRMKRGRRKLSPRPRYTPSKGMPVRTHGERRASASWRIQPGSTVLSLCAAHPWSRRPRRRRTTSAERVRLVQLGGRAQSRGQSARTSGVDGPSTSASWPSDWRCSRSIASVRVTPSILLKDQCEYGKAVSFVRPRRLGGRLVG